MSRHHLPDGAVISSGNPHIDVCNVCKKRPSVHFDDFYGYHCNLCHFKHPMKRTTNPWTGAKL
jgi:hypothetical protein